MNTNSIARLITELEYQEEATRWWGRFAAKESNRAYKAECKLGEAIELLREADNWIRVLRTQFGYDRLKKSLVRLMFSFPPIRRLRMNKLQITKLLSLDEEKFDGTIQSIILNSDLEKDQLVDILFKISYLLKLDKQALHKENMKLCKACLERGIDVNDVLFGGE